MVWIMAGHQMVISYLLGSFDSWAPMGNIVLFGVDDGWASDGNKLFTWNL
jgi:hypothetical protein